MDTGQLVHLEADTENDNRTWCDEAIVRGMATAGGPNGCFQGVTREGCLRAWLAVARQNVLVWEAHVRETEARLAMLPAKST